MRRAVVAMLLCALAFSAVGALPRPVAYYSFTPVGNGILEAFSGDASVVPPSVVPRSDGVSGMCLEFKRQDDSFVSLGRKFGFTGDFSLSFWVRTAPGYSDGEAVVLSRHLAGSYNGYIVFLNPAWGYGAANKLTFYYSNATVISRTSINDGRWHHVGIAYRKDSGAELFIDGTFEVKGPPNPITVPNVDFVLGSLTWGDRSHGSFPGSIDELAVFDQALGSQDFALLSADPGVLAKQFAKGGAPSDFYGGSTASTSGAIAAIRIVLKDGRVATIPLTDIERIEFVK